MEEYLKIVLLLKTLIIDHYGLNSQYSLNVNNTLYNDNKTMWLIDNFEKIFSSNKKLSNITSMQLNQNFNKSRFNIANRNLYKRSLLLINITKELKINPVILGNINTTIKPNSNYIGMDKGFDLSNFDPNILLSPNANNIGKSFVMPNINKRRFESNTEIILIVIYSLVSLIGTIGNGLVLIALIFNKRMRKSPRNIYILNLAFSDLILCLFTSPFTISSLVKKDWILGLFMCRLISSLQATNVFVSTMNITAIAVDRHQVILYPTSHLTHSKFPHNIKARTSIPKTTMDSNNKPDNYKKNPKIINLKKLSTQYIPLLASLFKHPSSRISNPLAYSLTNIKSSANSPDMKTEDADFEPNKNLSCISTGNEEQNTSNTFKCLSIGSNIISCPTFYEENKSMPNTNLSNDYNIISSCLTSLTHLFICWRVHIMKIFYRFKIGLVIIWLVSLAMATPLFIYHSVIPIELFGYKICYENWPTGTKGRSLYSLCSLLFQYVLPFLIVTISYIRIALKLRAQEYLTKKHTLMHQNIKPIIKGSKSIKFNRFTLFKNIRSKNYQKRQINNDHQDILNQLDSENKNDSPLLDETFKTTHQVINNRYCDIKTKPLYITVNNETCETNLNDFYIEKSRLLNVDEEQSTMLSTFNDHPCLNVQSGLPTLKDKRLEYFLKNSNKIKKVTNLNNIYLMKSKEDAKKNPYHKKSIVTINNSLFFTKSKFSSEKWDRCYDSTIFKSKIFGYKRAPLCSVNKAYEKRNQKNRKTNMLLMSIALVFTISWLPLNLFNLLSDMESVSSSTLFQNLNIPLIYACCHLFGMSSACSNPILYGWLNDNFKKEFKLIFSKLFSCSLFKYSSNFIGSLGF
ncbi:unnamed protein product [Gordionus sp. m RMFG-2023]|uniref:uncharacterized protein LOC135924234 n=1 Tax=Gordionus sp. m RMFG-2023 TaxID=3053472 RepID=UPI0030E2A110